MRRGVAHEQATGRIGHRRVPPLEHGRELLLLELGRRVHRGHVRAPAAEDAEAAEASTLAVQRDALGAQRVDDPRHVEVAGDGEDVGAVGAHRVHHAEGVGRVAEAREVAREDCPVRFTK